MEHEHKEQRAVALTYRSDVPAPFVSAKGRGRLASRLRQLAAEYEIPIVNDESITESLYVLDIGDSIPEDLYQVVAELFAFVYRATGKRKGE